MIKMHKIDRTVAQVRETNDYDKFEMYEINRNLKPNSQRFKNLVKSIKKHGFLTGCAIHCVRNGNNTLKIIQGHNRFMAAKVAEVPVKYIVSPEITAKQISIYDLETTNKHWLMGDYHDSYVKYGSENHIEVDEFCQETGIGISTAISLFSGYTEMGPEAREKYKKGKFHINDKSKPYIIADIVFALKEVGKKWAHNSNFVKALHSLLYVKSFDPEIFKEKAEKYSFLIEKKRDIQEFMEMIEEVYNYKTPNKNKIPLVFLAKQEADKRSHHIK
jgi:hypothetical protein